MALPGLSLPGLGLSSQQSPHTAASSLYAPPQQLRTRIEDLTARSEWRFEVSFNQSYTIRLLAGHAEIFGVELAPKQAYSFLGVKAAVFTWHGCQLEITCEAESEYVGQETEYAIEWLNVHGMLETARNDAKIISQTDGGPRVLVVGPDHVGKTSLVQSLAAWAVKCGRAPLVVNTDPKQGLLAPPGTFTALSVGSQMDVESGYGSAPISGQTSTPIKTPLVYHYPYSLPSEHPEAFKILTTRMAVSVTSKLEEDPQTKQSGLIIDTPGNLNDPKSNYSIIAHLVSEFSITCILTLGSERLYNDMHRRFGSPNAQEVIPVLRIATPGGAVERDASFMKALVARQIRQYFYGTSKEPLNPHSQIHLFPDLAIFRAPSTSTTMKATSASAAPTAEDDDDDYNPNSKKFGSGSKAGRNFERVIPSLALLNSIVAIKSCDGNSDEDTIRDSPVVGFAFVAEVDETKQRVRFLAPGPHRWGNRAMVWGSWPEALGEGINM